MSKEVVSGSAELIAAEAVVIVIAGHADLILKVGNPSVLLQGLPLPAGVDHARVRRLFNNAVRFYRQRRKMNRMNIHIRAFFPHHWAVFNHKCAGYKIQAVQKEQKMKIPIPRDNRCYHLFTLLMSVQYVTVWKYKEIIYLVLTYVQ